MMILGLTGILWSVIWFYIATDRPSEDKHMSPTELQYLTSTIRETPRIKVNYQEAVDFRNSRG